MHILVGEDQPYIKKERNRVLPEGRVLRGAVRGARLQGREIQGCSGQAPGERVWGEKTWGGWGRGKWGGVAREDKARTELEQDCREW